MGFLESCWGSTWKSQNKSIKRLIDLSCCLGMYRGLHEEQDLGGMVNLQIELSNCK